jgi:hypothetical protein
VSAVARFPDAPLGVAAVISILSFLWSDHDKQITTLGAYLAIEVEPKLRRVTGTYSWESFFRKMDEGGSKAALQLPGEELSDPSRGEREAIPRDRKIMSEYGLLFLWTPVVLLLLYAIELVLDEVDATSPKGIQWGTIARVLGLALTTAVLVQSQRRVRQREKRREVIRKTLTTDGAEDNPD